MRVLVPRWYRRSPWPPGLAIAIAAFAPRPALAQDGTPFFDDPPPSTSRLPSPSPAPVAVEPEPPPGPPEDPGPPFGRRNSWVLTTAAGAGVSASFYTNSSATSLGFGLAPAIDYFFVRNVSIGIATNSFTSVSRGYGADYSLVEVRTSGVLAGPRLGLNIRINELFSFYPTASFGIEWRRRDQEIVSGGSSSVPSPLQATHASQTGSWIQIFAPLLVHPRSNVFLGFGPTFFHEFARTTGGPDVGGERTIVGGEFVAGGHFGGAAERSSGVVSVAPRRFGDSHHLVFSVDGAARWTSYGGSDSDVANVSLEPGVDYFVGHRISVGLGAAFAYSFLHGVDPANGAAVAQRYAFGAGTLRVGYDVRVSEWMSVYPRASFVVGGESFDLREGTSGNRYTDVLIQMRFAVPLLFHLVPHVSIGVSPFVGRDLARLFQPTQANSVLQTSVGATVYVGLWL